MVARWFERVCNWWPLVHAKETPSFEAMKLYFRNVELFNDPIFGLPEDRFDSSGNIETYLAISELVRHKPISARTKADHKRFDDYWKLLESKHKESTRNETKT